MRRITQLLLLSFGIFLLGACAESGELAKNELILNHFSPEEAQELETVQDFFMGQISDASDKSSSEAIADLDNLLQELKVSAATGVIAIPINYQEEKELIAGLSRSLFEKIWIDLSPSELGINIQADYIAFLDELGEKHPVVLQYSDDLRRSGAISAGATARLLMSPEKFDTSDPAIRLLIAIHYMTRDYNNHISEEMPL